MRLKNIFNRITPLFFFDEGDPGGGGTTEPTAEEKKAAADKAKQQEELDKQFADRAKRAADAERKTLLETLGVTDPEEAKKLITAARESQAANQSELEKEQAARKTAEDAAVAAKAEAEKATADAEKMVIDTEIKLSAGAEVKDKDGKVTRAAFRKDATDDILLLISREGIERKDGKVIGVEKALEALAKAKPWLLSEPTKVTNKKGTPGEEGHKSKSGNEGERTPFIKRL